MKSSLQNSLQNVNPSIRRQFGLPGGLDMVVLAPSDLSGLTDKKRHPWILFWRCVVLFVAIQLSATIQKLPKGCLLGHRFSKLRKVCRGLGRA